MLKIEIAATFDAMLFAAANLIQYVASLIASGHTICAGQLSCRKVAHVWHMSPLLRIGFVVGFEHG